VPIKMHNYLMFTFAMETKATGFLPWRWKGEIMINYGKKSATNGQNCISNCSTVSSIWIRYNYYKCCCLSRAFHFIQARYSSCRGYTVPHLVEALRYESESRGLDSRWPLYDSGVESDSSRNEYQEYFLGGKGSWCIGLTTLPPSRADCLEI